MSVKSITRMPVILLFAVVAAAARPAAAQIALGSFATLGSPAEPPGIATGAGVFNLNPDHKKLDATRNAQLQGEYRFGDVLWIIAPFVGLMGTSAGAFYGYGGFGFDVNFGPNWVLTPTIAGGYWYRGGGLNLGSWWEFRSGAEIAYRLPNRSRLGLAFYHISNAGLTKENPGEQSLLLNYTVPLR